MSQTETFTLTLEQLSAKALAAEPTDKDAIVAIGSALEEAMQACSDCPAAVAKSARKAIETLQSVYEQASPQADALEAVANLLAEAIESLRKPGQAAEAPAGPAGAPASSPQAPAPSDAKPVEPSKQAPKAPAPCSPTAQNKVEFSSPTAMLPADTDMDLLKEFIAECLDHLSAGETSLLELESKPEDAELVNTIFRAFHTIKGTSGFLGLDRIQRLAHLAENLLTRARDGKIRVVGGYADLALKSCDTLRTMIESLRKATPGGELEIPSDLADLLTTLVDPEAQGIGEDGDVAPLRTGDILVGQGSVDRQMVEEVAAGKGKTVIGEALIASGAVSAPEVAKALRTQRKLEGSEAGDSTIRVGTTRLDSLIDMVGELVIAQSMVAQDTSVTATQNAGLSRKVSHAGKIVRELQDLAMSLRMVPLKGTFQKMARLARDVSKKSSKQVQFITDGEGTEIDRSMVEVLGDPLVHMIRNAIDHGVEKPEDRVKAGKNPTGTVTLRAFHAAGNVVIELCDDGRGLNREKILAKAIEKGIVQAGREMTDDEIFSLIFRAGFSTADKVTDVSGRGVGMDVVKKGIDSLRGRIDITSEFGKGATFALRLPLTMAISDAMLLGVGNERYLLPTISIEQSFRPAAGSITTVAGRGEMVSLRGQLLPMFRLYELFGVKDARKDPYAGLVIVLSDQSRRCALMVDELLGQQQVVIKSLGSRLSKVAGVSGGAILGDGRVGLILDASGLIALSHDKGRRTAA